MNKTYRIAVILATPIVGFLFLALMPRPVELIADNAQGIRLRIEMNGRHLGTLEKGQILRRTLQAGPVQLAATELGPEGGVGPTHKATFTLEAGFAQPRPTYIWNIGGRGAYWIATKGYGEAKDAPLEAYEPEGQVFEIPAELLPMLDGRFPDQVKERPNSDGSKARGATRRALYTARKVGRQLAERGMSSKTGEAAEAAVSRGLLERLQETGEAVTEPDAPPPPAAPPAEPPPAPFPPR